MKTMSLAPSWWSLECQRPGRSLGLAGNDCWAGRQARELLEPQVLSLLLLVLLVLFENDCCATTHLARRG